jgi:putative transposase
MIERTHPRLSVGAQGRLLSISRSPFYYAPQGETAMNLDLMLLIDRQFLDTPFYGVRQVTRHLQNQGHAVNQKRIRRLMRLMRLMPIYQEPDTSKPAKGRNTYPYLLGGLRIDRPNQVWCADITHLPMRKGFLYLIAIMNWFTRKVLAWRISNIEPRPATGQRVILPVLAGHDRRTHPAIFSLMAGVTPPIPMLGRSLL